MWLPRQARAALVAKPTRPISGGFGVLAGGFLLLWGVWAAVSLSVADAELHYSKAYVRAVTTSAMASAVWACLLFCAGAWTIDGALRRAFGIDAPPRSRLVLWGRAIVGTLLMGWLLKFTLLGDLLRFLDPDASPNRSLVIALGVWGVMAFDLRTMIPRAIAILGVRMPNPLARATPPDALPSRGRVRLEGTVTASASPSDDTSDAVYRVELNSDTTACALPFQLDLGGGRRVMVELDPLHARVIAPPDVSGWIVVRVGDTVTVDGDIHASADDPYRGSLPRVSGTDSMPIHIRAGDVRWNRRLTIAAAVELVAAGCLVAGALLLVAFRISLVP